jgi:DNA invertase Pin-like site-specific DNA recombinase
MNSKIVITLFSLFAELERDLISLRTKEALAAKRIQGVMLGKPKGTIQGSPALCVLSSNVRGGICY